jgi:hypothetical protein
MESEEVIAAMERHVARTKAEFEETEKLVAHWTEHRSLAKRAYDEARLRLVQARHPEPPSVSETARPALGTVKGGGTHR